MRGAVLEADERSGRTLGTRRVEETVGPPPGPEKSRGLPGQVPDDMEDGVRVLGADLHREITVAPSRVEPVSRERGHRDESGRPGVREPVPSVEERGPHADGDGQPVFRAPHRCHLGVQRCHPGSQGAAPHGQPPEELHQLRPVAGEDVKGGEAAERLLPGDDPGLVRAVERHPARLRCRWTAHRADRIARRHRPGQRHGSGEPRGATGEGAPAGIRTLVLDTFRHVRTLHGSGGPLPRPSPSPPAHHACCSEAPPLCAERTSAGACAPLIG